MHKWTPEQIVAIEGSIEKWERIVDGMGVDEGGHNCPLCKLIIVQLERCPECPVYLIGKTGCTQSGNPYLTWVLHHEISRHEISNLSRKVHCPTCKELAQDELDFLRRVLKEGTDA